MIKLYNNVVINSNFSFTYINKLDTSLRYGLKLFLDEVIIEPNDDRHNLFDFKLLDGLINNYPKVGTNYPKYLFIASSSIFSENISIAIKPFSRTLVSASTKFFIIYGMIILS